MTVFVCNELAQITKRPDGELNCYRISWFQAPTPEGATTNEIFWLLTFCETKEHDRRIYLPALQRRAKNGLESGIKFVL
jgi:hypothetical protein